jgi:hypothetical protein
MLEWPTAHGLATNGADAPNGPSDHVVASRGSFGARYAAATKKNPSLDIAAV